MSTEMICLSILLIGVLLLIGKWVRVTFTIFQKYFLPSSIIAEFIGLILGPEVCSFIPTCHGRERTITVIIVNTTN